MAVKPRGWGKIGIAIRACVVLPIWLGIVASVFVVLAFLRLNIEIPDAPDLATLEPSYPSRVEYLDGTWISGARATHAVPFEQIKPHTIMAFLAAEDENFFSHQALSPRGVARAAWENWQSQSRGQGASTISQQVARQFLTTDRTYTRKLRELLLARRIEARYSKQEILKAYLGSVFMGANAHGITQASWRYFDKDPRELTILEAATLAGVLPAPSVYSPLKSPDLAVRERNRVLRRLHEVGVLTAEQRDKLQAQPLNLAPSPAKTRHTTIEASARRALQQHFGDDAWEKGGITVVVQEHPALVDRAQKSLYDGVVALTERQKKELNTFEGSVLIVDPMSGQVLASVGSAFEASSDFDRSRQACRQPGSLFKPIVYAEALGRSITAATMLNDLPMEIAAAYGPVWNPRNADYDFRGYMTVADALAASRNIPVLRLAQHVGTQNIINRARKLGIHSIIDPARSMPLGASCVLPTEMAGVYSAFAREGFVVELSPVAYFKHPDGTVSHDFLRFDAWDPDPISRLVRMAQWDGLPQRGISEDINFIMLTLLRRVVERGTASMLPKDWAVAGKTGTTNEYDAWFAGIGQNFVAIVWIGAEKNETPLGPRENAGTVAVPVFESIFEGIAIPDLKITEEDAPERIEFVGIDRVSGLRARAGGEKLPFLRGTAPLELAPSRGTRQSQQVDSLIYDF